MNSKNFGMLSCCWIIANWWWWLGVNGNESGSVIGQENYHSSSGIRIQSQQRNTGGLTKTSMQGQQPEQDGTIQEPIAARLQCYLCSWSILGKGENFTNVDICSTATFLPEATPSMPCEHGCQTVSFRNSEKDDIRNFYRNCLKPDNAKELLDRCYKMKTVYGLEERCECLGNLCNSTPSINFPNTMAIFLAVLHIPFLIPLVNFNLFA